MSEQAQTQTFVLQRIYVKDMSFESPKAPDAFLQQWKPQINLEINTNNKRIGDDNFEVTLSVKYSKQEFSRFQVWMTRL